MNLIKSYGFIFFRANGHNHLIIGYHRRTAKKRKTNLKRKEGSTARFQDRKKALK